MKRIALLIFCAYLTAFSLNAQQKQITDKEQAWIAYFNQTRFSKHWGLWADLHLRTTDHFAEKLFQGIVRVGATYYLSDQVRATLGYGYLHSFPGEGHLYVAVPEHRALQQILWTNAYTHFRTLQWLRLEERFRRNIKNDNELADDYTFNYRVRYNLAVSIPLFGKNFAPHSFYIALNNELFINFGKNIVYNYFDQNRAFAGIGYQIARSASVQAGYMNVFQQLSSGYKFVNAHTIRVFVYHNIDLRKED